MDNKYKELRRNTLIIGVANLGSKAISFILAPLYSYWITVEQYGDMDLIISTVLLLTPVVCLDIYDATFRFASDSKYDNRTVLSVSLLLSFPCVALCAVISVVSALILGNHLLAFSSIYLALNLIESVLQQYERGRNHLEIFAISGITDSVFLLLFNLVFLIGLRMQITGWIISVILAKVIACSFLMVKSDCIRTFSLSSVRKDAVTDMLRFCIPLLPNTMMWWIMNLSDRYMIKIFVGAAATGLYSVANKIPNILSIFENVFYQSWQTSTIMNLDRSDREEFYSDVFNKYLGILAIGVISLLAFSKELTWLLFDDKFRDAWPAIAPLIIGVMVHALSTYWCLICRVQTDQGCIQNLIDWSNYKYYSEPPLYTQIRNGGGSLYDTDRLYCHFWLQMDRYQKICQIEYSEERDLLYGSLTSADIPFLLSVEVQLLYSHRDRISNGDQRLQTDFGPGSEITNDYVKILSILY